MKLSTTSPLELGIQSGAGHRDSMTQSKFRSQLPKDYNSLNKDKDTWFSILGVYRDAAQVTASHLFAYKHGQEAMDDIIGKIRPAELFSSRNGIIMSAEIEMYFDSGILAIVPDLLDKPKANILSSWVNQDVRDYKVRIFDTEWAKLDKQIFPVGELE